MQFLRCSLNNFTIVSIFVDDISQLDINKFTIKNGEVTIFVDSFSINGSEILLNLKSEVNIKFPAFVCCDNNTFPINYFDFYNTKEFDIRFYTDEALGIEYQKENTTFRLWSPAASMVNVLVYENGDAEVKEKPRRYEMLERNGLWQVTVKGNLKGLFYNYEVKIYDSINEAADPYAKACGVNGLRSAIIDMKATDPAGFAACSGPRVKNYTDAIIYEASVRDMSVHPDSGIKNKGKFLGLTEDLTVSSKNITTGLAHILELGVTHVQFMPIFDFSYESVNEKHPYKYNWGYDPQNYNIPEGSYASDPYDTISRIYELKNMIYKFHKHGIGIIMDVVYNHIFKYENSNLEKIFPGYYFRQYDDGTYCNGTGCGNDIASEKSMVRRFITDSLIYWVQEYKVDGFRFDLMGILDKETMNSIYEVLKEKFGEIIMYGEGWYMNTNLKDEDKANMNNSYAMEHIGFFNDCMRDVLKGTVFNSTEKGFVSGREGLEASLKFSLQGCSVSGTNRNPIFSSPMQCVNYSSCHDNYTLWDKLKLSCPEASEETLKDMSKLADGIVLTSMGVPLIYSGSEFCRTKNGIENSYNSTDAINWMDWNRKYNFMDVFQYYKGLIALRKAHSAFRLSNNAQLLQHMDYIYTGTASAAFILKNHAGGDSWENIIVIYNGSKNTIHVPLPNGAWQVVVDKHTAGTTSLYPISNNTAAVEPVSMMVMYSDN